MFVGLMHTFLNITTNIQMFGEVVVESKPCEMNLVKNKDKQAQMTVADLSPPISVDNIQLKLKQKINIKGEVIFVDKDDSISMGTGKYHSTI
jgi:hypothetical protein